MIELRCDDCGKLILLDPKQVGKEKKTCECAGVTWYLQVTRHRVVGPGMLQLEEE